MLELSRLPEWPEALSFTVGEHRKHAFTWGQWDCATFFADAVFGISGTDPFADIARWDSESGAMKSMLRAGYRSVQAFLDDRLPRIAPSAAQRGDCGYTSAVGALSCPLVIVGAHAVSRTEHGWIMVPVSRLEFAYRIG